MENKKYIEQTQYERATEAVRHLKDDNNDGHKLYAIAECLLALTEQTKRIVDILNPPYQPLPCSKCGIDLRKETHFAQAPGEEAHCYGGCNPPSSAE